MRKLQHQADILNVRAGHKNIRAGQEISHYFITHQLLLSYKAYKDLIVAVNSQFSEMYIGSRPFVHKAVRLFQICLIHTLNLGILMSHDG